MRVTNLLLILALLIGSMNYCFAVTTISNAFPPQLFHAINKCIDKIDSPELDKTNQPIDVKQDCPNLNKYFNPQSISQWLSESVDQYPTLDQLRNIANISQSLQWETKYIYQAEIDNLSTIVAELYTPESTESGWWSRFLKWLAAFFKDNNGDNSSWIAEFFSHFNLPDWVGTTIINTLLIVFVISILAFIVIELKTAGIRNWFKRSNISIKLDNKIYQEAEFHWDAIENMPSKQRLLAGFSKLVSDLQKCNVIYKDDSATNQELARFVQGKISPSYSSFFIELCNTVDNIIYGGIEISPDQSFTLFKKIKNCSQSIQA